MKKIHITETVGRAYGHIPGHDYRDVDVTVTRSSKGRWKLEVLETWGSAQGYDEEHGRREVYACSSNLEKAGEAAERAGLAAGMNETYLVQALSKAIHAADEAAEDDSETLEGISTADLKAELAKRGQVI